MLHHYRNHPSVTRIRSSHSGKTFSFSLIEPQTVFQVIKNLDPSKSVIGSIPTKIIKEYVDVIYIQLTDCINASVLDEVFPTTLKISQVTPVYKEISPFIQYLFS